MSFAVIESKADFNSAGTELLAAPEFAFGLVGVVVHATAKQSTAANETIAWIRFFILVISSIPLLDLMGCSMPKRGTSQTSYAEFFRSVKDLIIEIGVQQAIKVSDKL